MAVYIITCGVDREDPKHTELTTLFTEQFDSIRVMETVWLLSTDATIDEIDDQIAERYGDTKALILAELAGDFSMQGLPQGQMEWIDERFGGGEE